MNRKMTSKLNHFINLALLLALVLGVLGLSVQPAAAQSGARLLINGVRKGESVTITAEGFPAHKEFRVLMNRIGTQGVDGTNVGTATTDSDGEFTKAFAIPKALQDDSRIAIRIEVTDRTGWYAYNWFDNVSQGTSGSVSSPRPSTGSSGGSSSTVGYTTGGAVIDVVDVEEDDNVSIEVDRLPANTRFNVWFEWKNAKGKVTSVGAGSLVSNSSGSIDETVNIPRQLRDRKALVIKLASTGNSRIAVSAWFLNANSDGGVGAGSPDGFDGKIPYLEIVEVEEGDSVTIKATNLPAKTEFVVLMGRIGTEGKDGTEVDTVRSDSKGTISGTFDIPRSLRNRDEIAIRIEAEDNPRLYAFNWFENETTP